MLLGEGLDNVRPPPPYCTGCAQRGCGMGDGLCADPNVYSDTVSAIKTPANFNALTLSHWLRKNMAGRRVWAKLQVKCSASAIWAADRCYGPLGDAPLKCMKDLGLPIELGCMPPPPNNIINHSMIEQKVAAE